MGEFAEGLLNGDYDSITGVYLGKGNGYPRTKEKETYYEDLNLKKYARYRVKVRDQLTKLGYNGPRPSNEVMKEAKQKGTGPKAFAKFWRNKHK